MSEMWLVLKSDFRVSVLINVPLNSPAYVQECLIHLLKVQEDCVHMWSTCLMLYVLVNGLSQTTVFIMKLTDSS